MNAQENALLVTLDLTSAFDTVNHEILINRPQSDLNIDGKALDWLTSYLRKVHYLNTLILNPAFLEDPPLGHFYCICF